VGAPGQPLEDRESAAAPPAAEVRAGVPGAGDGVGTPLSPGDGRFENLLEKARGPKRRGWFGWLRRDRRPGPMRRNGSVPHDGFFAGGHGSKRERERRYGEVWSVEELPGGSHVRLELPRVVPVSAARTRLGIGDEMPDYDVRAERVGDTVVVRGRVADPRLRTLCGISPAFPADFRSVIPLVGPIRAIHTRRVGKTLEILAERGEG
jgi:hypothetical protein